MPTRNINLTDHYDDFLVSQLASGRFKNASEVVRAGLSLLEKSDKEEAAKLNALRGASATARTEIENGEYIELADKAATATFFEGIKASYKSS